jgi:hypothetical protein
MMRLKIALLAKNGFLSLTEGIIAVGVVGCFVLTAAHMQLACLANMIRKHDPECALLASVRH